MKKQIVNQVEGHSEICTKTRLAENLRRYAAEKKLDCCWVPETYIVAAGLNEGWLQLAMPAHALWHPFPQNVLTMNQLELDGLQCWYLLQARLELHE